MPGCERPIAVTAGLWIKCAWQRAVHLQGLQPQGRSFCTSGIKAIGHCHQVSLHEQALRLVSHELCLKLRTCMVVLLPLFSATKICRSLSIQTWAVLVAVCAEQLGWCDSSWSFPFALRCLTVLLHLSQSEILFVHTQEFEAPLLGSVLDDPKMLPSRHAGSQHMLLGRLNMALPHVTSYG